MRAPLRIAVTCGAVLGLSAACASAATVKAPKGTYEGGPGDVILVVNRSSIDLAAFSFRCTGTRGRMSINSVRLRRTSRGYRFILRANGAISFPTSTRPDQNGAVRFSGRFSTTGRSARGSFRVSSRHCRTGAIKWTAKR